MEYPSPACCNMYLLPAFGCRQALTALNTLLLPYLLFLMVFPPNIIRVCYMPVGNSAGLVLLSCLHRMDQRIEVMQPERVRVYVCMCIKRRDSRLQMSSNLVIQVYSHALDLLFKYCAR